MKSRERSAEFERFLDAIEAEGDPLLARKTAPRPTITNPSDRSFEEVSTFVDANGREPNAVCSDPREVMLGTRLETFRSSEEHKIRLASIDRHNLLSRPSHAPASLEDLLALDDDLLKTTADHIFDVKNVPGPGERAEPDRIAGRRPCEDFDQFAPIFHAAVQEIAAHARRTRPTNSTQRIAPGDLFIVDGHMAYIASINEPRIRESDGKTDARLRIVYDNGTESDHLMLSFSKALYRDPNARRVTAADGDGIGLYDTDRQGVIGYVYLARTLSNAPELADFAEQILKIGSTTNTPGSRIAGAANDPTFLFADAVVVQSFEVRGMHPLVIEKGLHAFFAAANVGMTMPDRFGRAVDAREWFLVSPSVVVEAIKLIGSKVLANHVYDLRSNAIRPIDDDQPTA